MDPVLLSTLLMGALIISILLFAIGHTCRDTDTKQAIDGAPREDHGHRQAYDSFTPIPTGTMRLIAERVIVPRARSPPNLG